MSSTAIGLCVPIVGIRSIVPAPMRPGQAATRTVPVMGLQAGIDETVAELWGDIEQIGPARPKNNRLFDSPPGATYSCDRDQHSTTGGDVGPFSTQDVWRAGLFCWP